MKLIRNDKKARFVKFWERVFQVGRTAGTKAQGGAVYCSQFAKKTEAVWH